MASSPNGASESINTAKCSNPVRRMRVVAKLKGLSARESEIPVVDSAKPWVFVDTKSGDSSGTVKITFGDQSSGLKESYGLDHCYHQNEENVNIFTREIKSLISGVFDGHNSTVIAYGAKGSGKTSLIQGFKENPGLAALSMVDFLTMAEEKGKIVSISFYEVYLDHVYDLLDVKRPPVLLLDDGRGKIKLKGLSRVRVNSISEFYKLYFSGSSSRKPTQKMAAELTLRSHKGLIVYLSNGDEMFDNRDVKMNFVDLAGYEDARKKSTDGLNFVEISKVNKSIYALLNVLYALNINESHVPYRESKLTRMLQDSFEANSKIVVAACLNPSFCQDTIYMVSLGSRLCQENDRDILGCIRKAKASTRNLGLSQKPGSVTIHAKKQNISQLVHSEKKPQVNRKMDTPMRRRKLFVNAQAFQKSNKENILKTRDNNSDKEINVKKAVDGFSSNEISSICESCIVGEVDNNLDNLAAEEFSIGMSNSKDRSNTKEGGDDNNEEGSTSLFINISDHIEEVSSKTERENEESSPKEDVKITNENVSSQINETRSPPLSERLRDLTNEMRSLCSARPLSMKIPPTCEAPSSDLYSISFMEYKTPVRKENIINNDGNDAAPFNSPWERFSSRSKGVQNSLVEDYLKFLNTANKEELTKLKGIGNKRATAIIEFRDASPEPFKSLDDLKEIGLSAKQIKGLLRKEMGGLFN